MTKKEEAPEEEELDSNISEEEEEDTEDEEDEEESGDSEDSDKESVDYEAELTEIRRERDRLEGITHKQAGALREERKRRKEAEGASKEEDNKVEDAPDGGSTRELIRAELQVVERRRAADAVEEILEEVSDSPAERKLIEELYDSYIVPTGYSRKAIQKDLLNAKLLANRQKYMAEVERKVRKGLAQKEAIRLSSTKVRGKREEATEETKPKYTKKEKTFLRRFGVDPDKE